MAATNFGQLWPSTWTTDGTVNNATVTAGANSANSGTIANYGASPNEVLDTEITVTWTNGATVTGGSPTVYVCRRTGGGFQSVANDYPYGVSLPAAVASTAQNITFVVRGSDVPDFQVVVANPSGNSSITGVTLKYRQSQGQLG